MHSNVARVFLLAFAILVGLATAACAPVPTVRVEPGTGLPAHDVELGLPGRYPVRLEGGRLDSTYGCVLQYEVHEPAAATAPAGATVVLAHGFLRDLRNMRGWAAHLASHGIRTVIASFCNSTPFDGRHARNAKDLVALAEVVAPGGAPVVYAGFSAGGLATSVAPVVVPALLLAAEPSRCNADGNFLSLARDLRTADVTRVRHATHCDFENPTSPACERLCGRVDPPAAAEAIRLAVRSLATAWVLEHAHER